ncbi:MAG TPA: response regulator [Candidatus Saccharimonadales bacterium]|nr:response regulator [Candidatus Saccharimonadales bacterium]
MAHILLVEDEQWTADCFTTWLTARNHTVCHVRDAHDALDAIDTQQPQLIVLDLLLPYTSGVQLLHALQSYVDLADIPVVLCSNSLPDPAVDLRPYGVRATVHKAGLTPKKLCHAVEGALHAAV